MSLKGRLFSRERRNILENWKKNDYYELLNLEYDLYHGKKITLAQERLLSSLRLCKTDICLPISLAMVESFLSKKLKISHSLNFRIEDYLDWAFSIPNEKTIKHFSIDSNCSKFLRAIFSSRYIIKNKSENKIDVTSDISFTNTLPELKIGWGKIISEYYLTLWPIIERFHVLILNLNQQDAHHSNSVNKWKQDILKNLIKALKNENGLNVSIEMENLVKQLEGTRFEQMKQRFRDSLFINIYGKKWQLHQQFTPHLHTFFKEIIEEETRTIVITITPEEQREQREQLRVKLSLPPGPTKKIFDDEPIFNSKPPIIELPNYIKSSNPELSLFPPYIKKLLSNLSAKSIRGVKLQNKIQWELWELLETQFSASKEDLIGLRSLFKGIETSFSQWESLDDVIGVQGAMTLETTRILNSKIETLINKIARKKFPNENLEKKIPSATQFDMIYPLARNFVDNIFEKLPDEKIVEYMQKYAPHTTVGINISNPYKSDLPMEDIPFEDQETEMRRMIHEITKTMSQNKIIQKEDHEWYVKFIDAIIDLVSEKSDERHGKLKVEACLIQTINNSIWATEEQRQDIKKFAKRLIQNLALAIMVLGLFGVAWFALSSFTSLNTIHENYTSLSDGINRHFEMITKSFDRATGKAKVFAWRNEEGIEIPVFNKETKTIDWNIYPKAMEQLINERNERIRAAFEAVSKENKLLESELENATTGFQAWKDQAEKHNLILEKTGEETTKLLESGNLDDDYNHLEIHRNDLMDFDVLAQNMASKFRSSLPETVFTEYGGNIWKRFVTLAGASFDRNEDLDSKTENLNQLVADISEIFKQEAGIDFKAKLPLNYQRSVEQWIDSTAESILENKFHIQDLQKQIELNSVFSQITTPIELTPLEEVMEGWGKTLAGNLQNFFERSKGFVEIAEIAKQEQEHDLEKLIINQRVNQYVENLPGAEHGENASNSFNWNVISADNNSDEEYHKLITYSKTLSVNQVTWMSAVKKSLVEAKIFGGSVNSTIYSFLGGNVLEHAERTARIGYDRIKTLEAFNIPIHASNIIANIFSALGLITTTLTSFMSYAALVNVLVVLGKGTEFAYRWLGNLSEWSEEIYRDSLKEEQSLGIIKTTFANFIHNHKVGWKTFFETLGDMTAWFTNWFARFANGITIIAAIISFISLIPILINILVSIMFWFNSTIGPTALVIFGTDRLILFFSAFSGYPIASSYAYVMLNQLRINMFRGIGLIRSIWDAAVFPIKWIASHIAWASFKVLFLFIGMEKLLQNVQQLEGASKQVGKNVPSVLLPIMRNMLFFGIFHLTTVLLKKSGAWFFPTLGVDIHKYFISQIPHVPEKIRALIPESLFDQFKIDVPMDIKIHDAQRGAMWLQLHTEITKNWETAKETIKPNQFWPPDQEPSITNFFQELTLKFPGIIDRLDPEVLKIFEENRSKLELIMKDLIPNVT